MNQWRSVRTVFGSNKVLAHPTHASPSFTHIASLASLNKKKTFWLLCNIIYPCVRVAGPARVLTGLIVRSRKSIIIQLLHH